MPTHQMCGCLKRIYCVKKLSKACHVYGILAIFDVAIAEDMATVSSVCVSISFIGSDACFSFFMNVCIGDRVRKMLGIGSGTFRDALERFCTCPGWFRNAHKQFFTCSGCFRNTRKHFAGTPEPSGVYPNELSPVSHRSVGLQINYRPFLTVQPRRVVCAELIMCYFCHPIRTKSVKNVCKTL